MSTSKSSVEEDLIYVVARWLVGRIVPDGQVRVVQSLLAGDTLSRVEVEELLQEINGQGVGTRE